ncbi:MAG: hypothetical protein JRH07_08365 [Deltaproteobacteria bacterium]|nr:hypothetical protein [Deltaproteobacteria bacterium]
MRSSKATLILWMRSEGDSEAEQMVSGAKRANVLDHVEKACHVEEIGSIILVTNCPIMEKSLKDYPVILERVSPQEMVPFGERLGRIIRKHRVEALFYVGGGSGVFMDAEDMARMARAVLASPDMLLVNNFFSTDFAALGRDVALGTLGRCRKDNHLGMVLGRDQGVKTRVLPPSLMARFDIDTPTDLMMLKTHPPREGHISRVVSDLPMDISSIFHLMDVLVDRDREAAIMGRIPPEIALFFDRETACHLRFHIEERGMEGGKGGEAVWSLVGLCLEKAGIASFFRTLGAHIHGAVVDSRVFFRHFGLHPSRRDRFSSDILQPEEIADPWVRLLTEAARECPIPVILGGHTLVSGGLYILAEAAWKKTGRPLIRDVEQFHHRGGEGKPPAVANGLSPVEGDGKWLYQTTATLSLGRT